MGANWNQYSEFGKVLIEWDQLLQPVWTDILYEGWLFSIRSGIANKTLTK